MSFDPAHAWLTLTVLMFGACVGSFLNVCIHRIPIEESVVRPRSRCPVCGHPIRALDNIPFFSYLALRGRCRHCRAPIPFRYPLVEGLTAALFLAVWFRYGWDARTPVYWLACAGLVLGTFVDLDHMILPDRVTLGGIAAGLVLSPLIPSLHGEATAVRGLLASLFGAGFGLALLGGVALAGRLIFRKEAMGMGDVKLLGAVGALLGWQAAVFTVIVSAFAGSAVGLVMIARGLRDLQSRIPYGPYLATAVAAWILGADAGWRLYLQWMRG